MRIATYTLRIQGDGALAAADQESLQRAIQHAKDVVNDALPEGYYCKIDQGSEGVDIGAVERLEQYAQGDA